MVSKRSKPRNPKNFWDQSRLDFLKDEFAKAVKDSNFLALDRQLAMKINEAYGAEFSENTITIKRSELGLRKPMFRASFGRSMRTKEADERVSRLRRSKNAPTGAGLSFKKNVRDFKKGEMVYVPNFGVCRYDGFDVIGGGGMVGDTKALLFTIAGGKPKRKYVLPYNLEREKIRALINQDQAREIEDILRGPRKAMGNPMKTMHDLSERMRSPDFRVVASVIRDALGDDIALSYREKAEETLSIVAYEYAAALGMGWDKASEHLRKIALAPKRGAAREPACVNG